MKKIKSLKEIVSNKLEPLYLITGEEEFLREETINLILNKCFRKETRGFNVNTFYGDEVEGGELYNCITSYSMFSPYKSVVIKDCDRLNSRIIGLLNRYLDSPNETTVLIFEAGKLPTGIKFFEKLKNKSCHFECKKFYERDILTWIKERVYISGKNISEEAVMLMFESVGLNIRTIANEIDKCLLYIGERNKIEVEDVENVVGTTRKFSVFELNRAIGEKNTLKALYIVSRMIELGEPLQKIIRMIGWYMSIIGRIVFSKSLKKNTDDLRKEIGVAPFYWKNYLKEAENFSEESIKKSFEFLLEADYNSKRSYQNNLTIGTVLVYNLCKLQNK